MDELKEVEELFSGKNTVLRETCIYNSKDVRTFKCLNELLYYMCGFENCEVKSYGLSIADNFYDGKYLKLRICISLYPKENDGITTRQYYDLLDINSGKYLKDNMYVKTDLIHEYACYCFKQIRRNYIIDNILNYDI